MKSHATSPVTEHQSSSESSDSMRLSRPRAPAVTGAAPAFIPAGVEAVVAPAPVVPATAVERLEGAGKATNPNTGEVGELLPFAAAA